MLAGYKVPMHGKKLVAAIDERRILSFSPSGIPGICPGLRLRAGALPTWRLGGVARRPG